MHRGVKQILSDNTGAATGAAFPTGNASVNGLLTTTTKFQAYLTGTGACAATVVIEGTNDVSYGAWVTLATITLSGTAPVTDGYATVADWPSVRAKCTAISGTGANVVVTMGA